MNLRTMGMEIDSKPEDLDELERKIITLKIEKEALARVKMMRVTQ